jgi:hypothetical protein
MFLAVGVLRGTWLCWLLWNNGRGYNKFYALTQGLIQLLVLAMVVEALWKVMRAIGGYRAYASRIATFCAVVALTMIAATAGIGRQGGDAATWYLLLQRYSEMALMLWLWLTWALFRVQFRVAMPENLTWHVNWLIGLLLGDGLGNGLCAAFRYPDPMFHAGRWIIMSAVIIAGIGWAVTMKREGQHPPPLVSTT